MSKKQDAIYFDNFIACAQYASQAAQLLKEIFHSFDPSHMSQWADQLHEIEHAADKKRHVMTDKLAKAFITPIEREDIADLSGSIDTLVDKLEEVCIRLYIHNIQSIRTGAMNMLDVVIRSCEEVCRLMEEFADFRHSKKLKDYIIKINSLEEESDRLFIANMRELHVTQLGHPRGAGLGGDLHLPGKVRRRLRGDRRPGGEHRDEELLNGQKTRPIQKVPSADMWRMDGTHTGKFGAESVRAALRRCARFSAKFCPQGDTRGRNFCPATAGRNGFPLERVENDTLKDSPAGLSLSFYSRSYFVHRPAGLSGICQAKWSVCSQASASWLRGWSSSSR